MHNIAIRMEGGLGDHLLANRFTCCIREKYPLSNISLFSDTEGNSASSSLLFELFPSFYNQVEVIQNRKNSNYVLLSKFGVETYPADLNNLPDEIIKKFNTSDKFYDLHIDSLKWLNQDFDWLRYYYFFPKPQIELPLINNYCDEYVLCHLYARPNSPYNLDQQYVIQLIKKISKFINVVIITQEEHKDFYKEVLNEDRIFILTPSLKECFSLASKCRLFIGIDSGIRYIPYHFSKPVFVFSKYCKKYGSVAPSHLIRWLIFEKNVFPINFDLDIVEKILKNCYENSCSQLFPEFLNDIDIYTVNRFS